ncbi:hypothetical protein AXZ77_2179 [Thioclava sp. ES.031]|uniref:hypothetical protein n=1 Tax=Thioclava sp. ES.031 TaxID=1798203 RepID=UPI000BF7F9C7|nr:hypothetical protein [Thioclava sp. ES.031]PFG63572.1 hypothetical protein AXZ77_2179 [Thioclava sp. ES.031]
MNQHHIFIAAPASGGMSGQMARTLGCGQDALARAGYGPAVIGAAAGGRVYLDSQLIGDAAAGLYHLFARAQERAERFREALSGSVGRVVLYAPSYEDYYPALWRDLAARRPLKPFAELTPRLMARPRRWVNVVRDLKAGLNPREIIVLPHGSKIGEAMAALVPGASLDPAPDAETAHADTVIAMMQRLHHSGVVIGPKQKRRLARFHHQQPQGTPIAEFDPLDRASLQRRYEQDLEQMAAIDGVRIGPDEALQIAAQ